MDRWHLQLAKDVAVSFQRFGWPPSGIVPAAPPSLGALPVAIIAEASTALLPVAPGEALWIGLDPIKASADASLAVAAQLSDGRIIDVISGARWNESAGAIVSLLHRKRIEGIARPDGMFDVIGRAPNDGTVSCAQLEFYVLSAAEGSTNVTRASRVALELVDYAIFQQRTGMNPPAPLDPTAGYRGHRLP